MTVNRLDLESVWREQWIVAPDGATTFHEALTANWQASRALNAGGSLSNISRNSSAHGYAPPDPDHRTTIQAERVALQAIRYYEALQLALGVDQDTAGELAIYLEGLARHFLDLDPAPEYRTDFSQLRCA